VFSKIFYLGITTLFLLVVNPCLKAQVYGIVRDLESGIPLPGTEIKTAGQTSFSDGNGQFTIEVVPGSVLYTSHLGYFSDSIFISADQNSVTIFLTPKTYMLNQVVVRSPLLHSEQLTMPSSIASLNNVALSLSDNMGYIDVLNNLSGTYVHKGTMSTSRITVRGMGARTPYATNRIKAYYNEIPLSSGDGTTLVEDIDPAFIQSLSLIKGAKSAFYGSGIGGVLLLSGKNYFKEGIRGGIALEGGNFKTVKPNAWVHYHKNDFSLSSGYSFVHSDGYRENSTYDRHNFHLYSSLNKRKFEINFLFHLIDVYAKIPSSVDEETFINSAEKAAANWLSIKGFENYTRVLTGLKSNYFINEEISHTTILYGNLFYGYESRPFNILDDQSFRLGFKSYLNYKKGNFSLRSGIDYMFENYFWSIYETIGGMLGEEQNRFKETRHPYNLFVQSDLKLYSDLIIEAGLSYNSATYRLYDLNLGTDHVKGDHAFKPAVSPFMGINYTITRAFNLYGSVGHGFSYPSVEETLLPDGQINPELKPESGINYEIGTRYQSANGDLFLDGTLYLMYVKNLLVTKRLSEAVFFGENAGKTRHMGFELMGGYRFNRDQHLNLPQSHIKVSLTVSDHKFTEFIDDGQDFTGNSIPGIPGTSFTTTLKLMLKKNAYINMQYRYSGAQFMDDENTVSYKGYHNTGFKVGKTFTINKGAEIEIYTGVNNVMDVHYASMILINAPSFGGSEPRYYYPGQPRYFYGGIRINLNEEKPY
jgi:iron complex outermembrane receptor protein